MKDSTPADAGWYLDEYDGPRFWKFVDFHGGFAHESDPLATATGECWVWTGGKAGSHGTPYGSYRVFGKMRPAHRIAFKDFNGRIADDEKADHLCRNTLCVRASHIEAVTQLENVRRGKLGDKRRSSPKQ